MFAVLDRLNAHTKILRLFPLHGNFTIPSLTIKKNDTSIFLSCTLHIYIHTHNFYGDVHWINLSALWQFRAVQSSSTQSLRLPIFQISSASFHILSESKRSLSGSLHSCSYTFPPFCNSFTHLTSHSYCYLVLRHQFSHQITKAWCIKIFNKPQGTVISVTAISVSTEMQTYAQTYF